MENFDISLLLRREEASVQNYYNSTPIIKTYYRFKTKVQDGKWRTIHAMQRTPWLSILVVCKRQESVPCRHPSATIEPKIVTHVSPWKEPTKKFLGDLYQKLHCTFWSILPNKTPQPQSIKEDYDWNLLPLTNYWKDGTCSLENECQTKQTQHAKENRHNGNQKTSVG